MAEAIAAPVIRYLPASKTNEETVRAVRALGFLPIRANDIYLPNRYRPERVQILYGGSGSGKSDWKATELLLKCLLNPFCRVLFMRKHSTQIRDSHVLLFKDLIKRYNLQPFFSVKESEMDIHCTLNGNVLLSAGLDDVDKLKSVADITDAWIEEPMDKKGSILSTDFTELDRRLRSLRASNHIHLTFNPISRESWIYDYFFRSDSYKPFTLKTTYLDNHFSPPEQNRQFEILKERKPDEFAVYALGEWGSLKQGLVFQEYNIVAEFPADCRRFGYGLDWGFYPDPTAVIKCGFKNGELFLDEVIYDNNLTSRPRAELMRARGIRKTDTIIADRNPEAIQELRGLGFPRIEAADKGPGSVKAGLDLMKNFRINITARSTNLKRELDNYSWATDRRDGLPTGEPMDEFNHAIDAARYWCQKFVSVRAGMPGFI